MRRPSPFVESVPLLTHVHFPPSEAFDPSRLSVHSANIFSHLLQQLFPSADASISASQPTAVESSQSNVDGRGDLPDLNGRSSVTPHRFKPEERIPNRTTTEPDCLYAHNVRDVALILVPPLISVYFIYTFRNRM